MEEIFKLITQADSNWIFCTLGQPDKIVLRISVVEEEGTWPNLRGQVVTDVVLWTTNRPDNFIRIEHYAVIRKIRCGSLRNDNKRLLWPTISERLHIR